MFSCQRKNEKSITFSDGKRAVGNISEDSIFNGLIKYYDKNTGKILEKTEFFNGIRDGLSYGFDQNEKVEFICKYEKGKLNGNVYFFDSLGQLTNTEHYYEGLRLGSKIKYVKNEPKIYEFIDLEESSLLKI